MLKAIRRFIERGRKGYCKEDMWSFNNWLSSLLANALREFKQNCHTYPNDIDEWDEWMKILDEMIECFEEQGRDIETNMMTKDFVRQYLIRQNNRKQKLHRGLELLEKYWWDLWD